ncbi:MAG TPA: NCS1 family nucleobase:cation symporter-1 [Haliangiales bacterium]|nr:NCS1 family nucleobase:cation symporter-1 [Haliangiales bacterium]
MHTPAPAAEVPIDVLESHLYSSDLGPVPASRRTWGTYNFAALWISMAHCIPTYMLAGTLIAVGMSWWQALLTIGLGNCIVLVPILLNAHPGTQYGIPFPVLARASFGTAGAQIPAMLRAIVACGWFGIQTYVGGEAVKTFLLAIWPGYGHIGAGWSFLGLTAPSAITFLIFWTVNIYIIFRGMNAVRVFENWAAPIVLVMAAALLMWIVRRAGGFGPVLDQPTRFSTLAEFWPVFVPSLTAMVGFWATLSLNIPDFTRYGRGQRQQMLGQTLGLPPTMILFSAMGVVITSAATAIFRGVDAATLWDPIVVLSQLTAPGPAAMIPSAGMRLAVALLALVGVAIATVSVNIAANVVSPANDFANLAPRRISFKMGGLITGLLGIAMMPWKVMAHAKQYIFTWLVGYSALLGPIAGIMIVDYWILRGRRLNLYDLYRPQGEYAGVNGVAIVALVMGILPNVPGFLKSAGAVTGPPEVWDDIYTYAWFIGFGIAAFVYWVGMKLKS